MISRLTSYRSSRTVIYRTLDRHYHGNLQFGTSTMTQQHSIFNLMQQTSTPNGTTESREIALHYMKTLVEVAR